MPLPTLLIIVLAGAAALSLFAPRPRRRRRSAPPPRTRIVASPTLGVLRLNGDAAAALVAEDRKAFTHYFRAVRESDAAPPRCDVLLLYCDVGPAGEIAGTTRTLREIIRDAGATVVIVASPNGAGGYVAAGRPAPYGNANLVMTLDRKGPAFTTFFGQLFAAMSRGVSMPVAWVKVAPQIPGVPHADAPDAIFACELGHLAFEPPLSVARAA